MQRFRPKRVALFLFLTFFLSWGIDWVIDLTTGVGTYADLGMTPLGMFIPAFVALVLRMYVFTDSHIHVANYRGTPRWILLAFLVVTLAYGVVVVLALSQPDLRTILQGVGPLLLTLWTLWVFFVFGRSRSEAIDRAGLRLGDTKRGQWFILGVVAFLLVQSGLNLIFGLGELQVSGDYVYGLPIPASLRVPALVVLFIPVAVIGLPLSGLAATFGEEYGWRGFLQDELVKLGVLRGVLLIGVVWGLWHFPVILSGVHTYFQTWVGLSLGMAFFVLWGVVQSYAVLKTGSIWVAAFMHGVVNSVYSFTLSYLVRPMDKVFSFGLGVFGLLCLAAVVAAILRDPVWRTRATQPVFGSPAPTE